MFGFLGKNFMVRKPAGAWPLKVTIAPQTRATPMGGDGIAFLHTGSGKLFTSNAIGARIWRELAAGAGLPSIAAGISSELGVPLRKVEEDAREFVAALEMRGLVLRERAWA